MSGIDYRQLRRQVSMDRVLELIGFQPAWQQGSQLRGPCPIPGCCSTQSRTFSVHRTREIYRCFACGSHGNPLDLWAATRDLPLYQAAVNFCHVANIALPRLPSGSRSHARPSSRVATPDSSRNR